MAQEEFRRRLQQLLSNLPQSNLLTRIARRTSSTDIIAHLTAAHAWAVSQFESLLNAILAAKEEELSSRTLYNADFYQDRLLDFQVSANVPGALQLSEFTEASVRDGSSQFVEPAEKPIKLVHVTGQSGVVRFNIATETSFNNEKIGGDQQAINDLIRENPPRFNADDNNGIEVAPESIYRYGALTYDSSVITNYLSAFISLLLPLGMRAQIWNAPPNVITDLKIRVRAETTTRDHLIYDALKDYLLSRAGLSISVSDMEAAVLKVDFVEECRIVVCKLYPRIQERPTTFGNTIIWRSPATLYPNDATVNAGKVTLVEFRGL